MTRLVLIPVYNEEESLGAVISLVQFHCPDVDILVVNSQSTDNSVAIAQASKARVVDASEPGYWPALCTGYRYALNNKYTQVVQLDGDGQHPSQAIPRFFEGLHRASWVIGSRYNTGTYMPLSTQIAQRILTRWVHKKTGVQLTDISSGMWGINTDAIQMLLTYKGETADAAIRLFALRSGLNILEIPVPMEERRTGQSMHHGLSSLVNFTKTVVDIYRS